MRRPPDEAVQRAIEAASGIARTTALILAGCIAGLGAGLVAAVAGVPQVGLLVAGFGLTFGALYGVAWRRASAARSALEASEFVEVRAVGWCRPPDGCNYALFNDSEQESPDWVLRLPVRREMKRSVSAWVAGRLEPSVLGGVALFDEEGLLATGRIVEPASGRKKWERRNKEPGRMVQRPPEGWYPPGSE